MHPLRSRLPGSVVAFSIYVVVALFPCAAAGTDEKPSADFRIYVSNETSGDVSVIDGHSGNSVALILVGKRPRGIQVSPDGLTLYVATSGSPRLGPGADPERAKDEKVDKSADGIAVVDLATQQVTRRLAVGSDPEQFALMKDDRRVIVSNEDDSTASMWEISSGRRVFVAALSGEPEGVALHPVGREVYVTCEERGDVFVLDVGNGREIAKFSVRGRPRNVVFSPDGSRAYIPAEGNAEVSVVDTAQHKVVATIRIPGADALPMGAVVSRDGQHLFVTTGRGDTVAVIDTATNRVESTIHVGARPWGVALSPDGSRLYTANGLSDDISVVDVTARKEISRVKTGGIRPWGVVVGLVAPKSRVK